MTFMTDEREDPEAETDESTRQAEPGDELRKKRDADDAGADPAPPTEAIILKSTD